MWKRFSKQSNRKKITRISDGFAVRTASGNRQNRADGFVPTAMPPNIFTVAVVQYGILLKPAVFARLALIVGVGHRVCIAAIGRDTTIGMKKIKAKVFHNCVSLCSDLSFLESEGIKN